MRGRKPTPTALHQLRGTFNATRHGKGRAGEPRAEGELPSAAPDWLTPDQQQGWTYAVQHAPAGVLRAIDAGLLAVWVEAECRHRAATIAQARLDQGSALPLLTKTRDGTPVQSPYLGIINRAALVMIKAASELGFSPAARPRLGGAGGAPEGDGESPWAEFQVISGGRG
jgi:P27 family predicted phage terminase small subunit